MLFPCMLLAWLAAFSFFLPTECGERIAYSTTILLSLVVFLLLIADNIPRSGDAVPVLGVYFCLTVCLVGLCTLMVIAAYNISLKPNDFCPPAWLTACCYRLGPLVGFRATHHNGRVKLLSFRMNPRSPTSGARADQGDGDNDGTKDDEGQDENLDCDAGTEEAAIPTAPTMMANKSACRHPPPEGGSGFANTWRYMGIVLDRMFFVIYCLLNLVATIWILASRRG
ncbi:hypothetical protein BOX15_Mlig029853g1 [Macrostomum lignano]|uniref:Neurotransmitter-gated ion-channel transmembrane domain-containing protein n=1 Tax=Macrostomum lignano TaxID=282301 RepID=A0A267FCA3_9PLAT|nr:hypothetical protein BOX15_Mlig029853g1 [Macrostomum lignano]